MCSDTCLKILHLERRAEDRRTAVRCGFSTSPPLCDDPPLQLRYIF